MAKEGFGGVRSDARAPARGASTIHESASQAASYRVGAGLALALEHLPKVRAYGGCLYSIRGIPSRVPFPCIHRLVWLVSFANDITFGMAHVILSLICYWRGIDGTSFDHNFAQLPGVNGFVQAQGTGNAIKGFMVFA